MTITEQNSFIWLFETKIGEAVSYVSKMCGAEKLRAVHFWNAVSEKLQIIVNDSAAEINAVALQMDENESEKITLEMNNSNTLGPVPQSHATSDFVVFAPSCEPVNGSGKVDQTVGISNSQFLPSQSFPIVTEASASCTVPTIHHISSIQNIITDPPVSVKSISQHNCDTSAVDSSYGVTLSNENIPCFKKDVLKKIVIKDSRIAYQTSEETGENSSFPVHGHRTSNLTERINRISRKRKSNTTKPFKLEGSNTYSKDKLDFDKNNSFVTYASSEDSFDDYKSDFEAIETAGESDSNQTESIVSFVVSNTEEILTKNKIALNMKESDNTPVSEDCNEKISHDSNVSDLNLAHAKSYACTECSALFQTKGNLVVHMRTHTGEKPFSCSKCKSRFTTRGNLKRHQRTHTGEKPFECNHCFSKFTEKKSLTVHMRRHTGEKPYQCNICLKKFAQTGVLQSHMDMHLNQKRHLCEHCGKSFRQRSQLHVHKLRHDNIKKFLCPTCEAKFLTKGDLERHTRVHTGERPFVCEICSKSFTRQQSLNEHTNRHYGIRPYICKHCNRAFSEMSACYKHEKAHSKQEEKPPDPDDSQSYEVDESTSNILLSDASDPLSRMMTLSGIF